MGNIKGMAVSNSSTLISFYRTEKFYPLLKVLFNHIIIPKDCWNEMITNSEEDYKFADRRRMLNDKDIFLKITELGGEEKKISDELMKIASERDIPLHKPEALAISIALNMNEEIAILTEDKAALDVIKKHEDLIGFNSSRVFQELVKNLDLFFVDIGELNKFLDEFEEESKTKFSENSRSEIINVWKKEQEDLLVD